MTATPRHTRLPEYGARPCPQQWGYLALLPSYRDSGDAAGTPLYLPLTGRIVVPHHRIVGGWDCVVLTDPSSRHHVGATVRLSGLEVQTALPVDLTDPLAELPADQFATVWLARVWQHTPGGHRYAVADMLAHQIRPPGTRTLILDSTARRRLLTATRVLPSGLTILLHRLIGDGLLARAGADNGPPMYQLTLPDPTSPPRRRGGTT